ncbi:MAG TPA: amidohydrolase [Ruminococcaceae bacterium]|nr:amidohydrolase [Oscillospiraceae bacterium]
MKIRFFNARIMPLSTNDNSCSIIEGELHTNGSKICYVGENVKDAEGFDREIDCKGNLIMPGFKNAHTHSAMTFLRSYADDLPLQEWLFNRVFPREDKLTPDDVYILTKLAIMEYLTSGITSCFDMYFFRDSIASAAIDTGYRMVLCGAVNGGAENAKTLSDEYQKFNNYNELISYQLGFHAEYTTSLDLMKEIARLSHEFKAPVFTHNSETEKEVAECKERHGKTPTALFEDLGMLEYGGGGFHCVHFNESDMNTFKSKGLWAVTNPGSNTKLASGIAPIWQMQKKGINIAIGTDGSASNNCLDMFREMFLVTGLQKIREKDAAVCDGLDVLTMAVKNGALAMGLVDSDCLAEGKNADLVMIDLNRPNMQPLNNIAKNLVYSGSKSNVKMTMVNGKILYENGEFFIGESPENIYRKCNETADRLR